MGTRETGRPQVDEETVDNVLTLDVLLRRRRLGPGRLLTVVEPEGAHSEDAWAGRLPRALEFLYGEPGQAR